MKDKCLIFLLFFWSINSATVVAQDTINPKFPNIVIKTDVLMPTIGILNKPPYMLSLTAEKLFNNKHSIQITGIYAWVNKESRKYTTTQVIPEYKFYLLSKSQYNKFYTGIYLKITKYHDTHITNNHIGPLSWDNKTRYIDYTCGFGGIIGYQIYYKKRIALDFLVGIGGRKYIKRNIIEGTIENPDYKKIDLDGRLAINMGYKF